MTCYKWQIHLKHQPETKRVHISFCSQHQMLNTKQKATSIPQRRPTDTFLDTESCFSCFLFRYCANFVIPKIDCEKRVYYAHETQSLDAKQCHGCIELQSSVQSIHETHHMTVHTNLRNPQTPCQRPYTPCESSYTIYQRALLFKTRHNLHANSNSFF